MTVDYSLWSEASRDLEGEHAALRMATAKVAVAGLWPFLALAGSESEFGHRLALAEEHMRALVGSDEMLSQVHASLTEDFRAMAASDDKPDRADEEDHSPSTDDEDEDDDPDEAARWRDLGRKGATFFHQGQQRWLRVAADEPQDNPGGGNPYYFTGGPEGGPNTGQTNQFPPDPNGGDPIDPLNQMYPAQPQPWTVPPGGEWKEAPMQFNPPTNRTAAQVGDTAKCGNCNYSIKKVHAEWAPSGVWTHTGEHGLAGDDDHEPFPRQEHTAGNPGYFAGGQEGVAGSDPPAFPEDLAVDDPDDRVNELYDHMNPQPEVDNGNRVANRGWRTAQTWSGYAGDPEPDNPAPDSDKLQGTKFDSPQERERWARAQAEKQQDSRASTTFSASLRGFFDPADPGVRMVAAGNPFDEGNNPFSSTPSGAPGQVTDMGSDGEGTAGMNSGVGAGGGMVPQTTPPRTLPSGGGGQNSLADEPPKTARRVHGDARNLAVDDDPTGYGDEYLNNQRENGGGPLSTRPRQSAPERGINTPQKAGEPIPTVSSPGPGGVREDDEDDRREASRVARQIVAGLVGR